MSINFWQKIKWSQIKNNKKVLLIFLLIVIAALGWVAFGVYKKTKEKNQAIKLQQQKIKEDARQLRMGAANWSRISFFENLPINVTFAIPDYLEGNYRLIKEADKASFLYIKDPSKPMPLFYIKSAIIGAYKPSEGEVEIISGCKNFVFFYRLYSPETYDGADKESFAQALYDIEYFLKNDGYFQCRNRE